MRSDQRFGLNVSTSLTGNSSCPRRDDFAVDEPADEHETCAAEGIRWLRKRLVSQRVSLR
jgi:hypothetical protein